MANDETRPGSDTATGERVAQPDGESAPTQGQGTAQQAPDSPVKGSATPSDGDTSPGGDTSQDGGTSSGATRGSEAAPPSNGTPPAGGEPSSDAAADHAATTQAIPAGPAMQVTPPAPGHQASPDGAEAQQRSPWAPAPHPAAASADGPPATPATQPAPVPAAPPSYPVDQSGRSGLPSVPPYPGTTYPAAGQPGPAYPAAGQPGAAFPTGGQPGGSLPPGAQPGTSYPPGAQPGPAGAPGWPVAQPTVPITPPTKTAGPKIPWVPMAIIALVAAILGGLLGGFVGYQASLGVRGLGVLPGVSSGDAPETEVEAVSQRVLPSVVQLRVRSGDRSGAGSGMVLTADGLLLTNNHVIENAAGGAGEITALFQDGKSSPVQIVGRDPESDIAVVKAVNASGLTPIEMGNSDAVRVGQQVVAVGSPLGLGGTVTVGIVSALDRAVSVGSDKPGESSPVLNAIQTDAAINPGNSGGPLVDIEGRLVGINSAIASVGGGPNDESGSVGLGFAIPINQAKRIADELQRTGQATKAVLGVNVNSGSRLAPLNVPPGAKLISVAPGGPGDKAGLKAGDVITKVNTRIITYGDELVAAIRSHAPGETVTITTSDGRSVSAVLDGQPVPASK